MMEKIGGVATILGNEFAFPTRDGYGLIQLGGGWTIVKFSCPLESSPPQGEGSIVAASDVTIKLEDGQLTYKGNPLVVGQPHQSL